MKTGVILSIFLIPLCSGSISTALGADAGTFAAPTASPEQLAATKERMKQLMADPVIQERSRINFRGRLPAQNPDVARVLDLSPEEVNRLFDLLTEQNARRRRELSAELNAGTTSIESFGRSMQTSEAEVATLLGSKYPKWQEYKRGLLSRVQASNLRATLSPSMPLTEPQYDSLVSALIAAQARIYQEDECCEQLYSWEKNQKRIEAAAPYLTALQLETFKGMLDGERTQEDLFFVPRETLERLRTLKP